MAESPSKTANYQRLNEMMCHLTSKGAVIPYNLCFDCNKHLWLSSKGGLFKFDENGKEIMFAKKNNYPKKIGPYSQIIYINKKVIYVYTNDKENLTNFQILSLSGEIEHEQFIDGKIQSLAINENGDIFLTKQMQNTDESIIYKSSLDCPLLWEEFSSSFDFCFQNLCVFDEETLAVATVTLPINIYSKQTIKWVNSKTGKIIGSFSCSGKQNGEIYFPRCMQKYEDDLLVLDKTGRFQRFLRDGKFKEISAKIDAYIGNGFVVRNDEAIIACSGIVLDKEEQTMCDDWLETIKLNGSSWIA